MSKAALLPKILRWVFTALMGITLIAGAAILFAIVNPSVFSGHGTMQISPVTLAPEAGSISVRSDAGEIITIKTVDAAVSIKPQAHTGLVKLIATYVLPVSLVYIAFFAFLFDMLRRLFRNVSRGESFSDGNLRLVRLIGYSTLVFSLAAAVAESWLEKAIFDYFKLHTAIPGFKLQFETTYGITLHGGEASFQWTWFLTGLLVLALAEVFRQGQALKRENDLTV
jgi:hypothetical protein